MNTENIVLNMTAQEADSVAHVLMAALHHPNMMLDRERKDATAAAQALFKQLGYGYSCDAQGNRVEVKTKKQEDIEAIQELLKPLQPPF
jgi:hypothetical protein